MFCRKKKFVSETFAFMCDVKDQPVLPINDTTYVKVRYGCKTKKFTTLGLVEKLNRTFNVNIPTTPGLTFIIPFRMKNLCTGTRNSSFISIPELRTTTNCPCPPGSEGPSFVFNVFDYMTINCCKDNKVSQLLFESIPPVPPATGTAELRQRTFNIPNALVVDCKGRINTQRYTHSNFINSRLVGSKCFPKNITAIMNVRGATDATNFGAPTPTLTVSLIGTVITARKDSDSSSSSDSDLY